MTLSVFTFLMLFTSTYGVYAEKNSVLMGGYTIEGVPNEHQLDKDVSYFYLKENPGDKDRVKVKLINDSSKEKTLEVKVTNANGLSVELESVGAILSDGNKVVQANILNPNPYLFGEATVSGKIMNEQEIETIQKFEKENVKIAPQSVYPFQIG